MSLAQPVEAPGIIGERSGIRRDRPAIGEKARRTVTSAAVQNHPGPRAEDDGGLTLARNKAKTSP